MTLLEAEVVFEMNPVDKCSETVSVFRAKCPVAVFFMSGFPCVSRYTVKMKLSEQDILRIVMKSFYGQPLISIALHTDNKGFTI